MMAVSKIFNLTCVSSHVKMDHHFPSASTWMPVADDLFMLTMEIDTILFRPSVNLRPS